MVDFLVRFQSRCVNNVISFSSHSIEVVYLTFSLKLEKLKEK